MMRGSPRNRPEECSQQEAQSDVDTEFCYVVELLLGRFTHLLTLLVLVALAVALLVPQALVLPGEPLDP